MLVGNITRALEGLIMGVCKYLLSAFQKDLLFGFPLKQLMDILVVYLVCGKL